MRTTLVTFALASLATLAFAATPTETVKFGVDVVKAGETVSSATVVTTIGEPATLTHDSINVALTPLRVFSGKVEIAYRLNVEGKQQSGKLILIGSEAGTLTYRAGKADAIEFRIVSAP